MVTAAQRMTSAADARDRGKDGILQAQIAELDKQVDELQR